MKFILIIILCFSLSGCWQNTSGGELKRGIDFCATRGGVDQIRTDCIGGVLVYCNDGARKRVDSGAAVQQ